MTAPQLEGATPRPWVASIGVGGRRHVTTGGGLNALGVATCFGEEDAALIVAAVNDYDRLRRIEEAARRHVALHEPDGECNGKCSVWPELRSALATAPSRPVEREEDRNG